MAKESVNLGRTTVGEQTLLTPAQIAAAQKEVQAQQAANPELTKKISEIASEEPVITDPTTTYRYVEPTPTPTPSPTNTPGVTTYTATDGTKFTDAQAYATYQASLNKTASDKAAAEHCDDRHSAFPLMMRRASS